MSVRQSCTVCTSRLVVNSAHARSDYLIQGLRILLQKHMKCVLCAWCMTLSEMIIIIFIPRLPEIKAQAH